MASFHWPTVAEMGRLGDRWISLQRALWVTKFASPCYPGLEARVLKNLIIEDLALVSRIELTFGPGLNVLSGETGAGKSVLLGALSLVLGSRASAEAIRTGADKGAVEALFAVPEGSALEVRLRERGIEVDDAELIVRRTLSRAGRSRVLLNGQMATMRMLGEVLRGVVDVTSQHEHVSLLDVERHLTLVDAYGGLASLLAKVADAHTEVSGYEAALDALDIDEAERARREDYLRFALDEIVSVDPQAGELETIGQKLRTLKGVEALQEGLHQVEADLYSSDGAAADLVGRAERDLERLAGIDPELEPLAQTARGLAAEIEELARSVERRARGLTADPEGLEALEERREQLNRLARKHGGSMEAVLAARSKMEDDLDAIEHQDARRADLLAALEAARETRKTRAKALTKARRACVRSFEKAVSAELMALSLGRAAFSVRLEPLEVVGPRGAETARFQFAPNPGEPPRSLRKIASGGELARVLLAVKHVLAHRGDVGTYVFDEIDTGIGGSIAEVLGRKLQGVSESTQALVVTHHPQVAAYADVHFRVQKTLRDGRALTEVAALDEASRVEELARMLGGVEITDNTRDLAVEMRSRGRRSGPRAPAGGAGKGAISPQL